jgi:hypothetical protein
MVRGAADSRDVFRAVSHNERRARLGRRIRAGVGSRGVSDIATAVCIRKATPPLAQEASARPALPPRSPWTSRERATAVSIDYCNR